MISPGQFIYNELVFGLAAKDYEDLCVWLLSNNIENSIILDIASNGTDLFDFDVKKNIILKSANIDKLTLDEKFSFVEKFLVEDFTNNKIDLRSLVQKLGRLCVNYNLYEEYGIWFELDESLDYYFDDGKGTLFYDLGDKPIDNAKELLRQNKKL